MKGSSSLAARGGSLEGRVTAKRGRVLGGDDETMLFHWEESATTKTAPFRRNPYGRRGATDVSNGGRRRPAGFVPRRSRWKNIVPLLISRLQPEDPCARPSRLPPRAVRRLRSFRSERGYRTDFARPGPTLNAYPRVSPPRPRSVLKSRNRLGECGDGSKLLEIATQQI